MKVDWMVAGAGFAGSVAARALADAGDTVLVVEKDRHVGGTAYDEYDEHGVLVQRYGGHIFHSGSDAVVDFLSRFTAWRLYEHRVLASVQGQLVPIPINLDTVNTLYGLDLTSESLPAWFEERRLPVNRIETAADVVLSKVGRDLYKALYENYSRKQWGRDLTELGPQVTARIPIRTNRDDRYFTDRYQMTPVGGYHALIARMLDHPGIRVLLGEDARVAKHQIRIMQGTIWTGPIDEFFEHRHGALPYRSMDFTYESHPQRDLMQPVATINYPNEHPYVRSTEFRHIMGQDANWTTIVYERPTADGPPLYPVPSPETEAMLRLYHATAKSYPDVHFTGRLGSYRYYNMDQVVAQSLALVRKLKGG